MTVLLSSLSLSKSYGPRPLFTNVSLDLRIGEHIGLIGPNGSGKSTLLKLLAGLEHPDTGTVSLRRTTRLGYLAQDAIFGPNQTVEEALAEAIRDDDSEEHERATQIRITLSKTGLTSGNQQISTLSGGWRKRVAIARELVRRPDLLLLDEPTNHLDLEGILWLEELLQEAPFAFVVVSHDRYFLENVTNQMIEIDRVYAEGHLRVAGNYSEFLSRREEYLAGQARQQQALASKVRREVEWLRRRAPARTGKSTSRIQEAGRLIEDLQAVKSRNASSGSVNVDFVATGRRSAKLLDVQELGKTLGERRLFDSLGFTLSPGTKLGLLGPNGSGKTTLLRVLEGELMPDQGRLVPAEGLKIAAFDQDRRRLDRSVSLRRALSPNAEEVQFRGKTFHITAWAKQFLFRPEHLDLAVGDLSGGEQARILIARLMLQPADVLLLDEPTNDLDIPSLEVLEESLADFPGALVLVTHDRALLDRLCTEILGLDGQGSAQLFADYTQWLAAQREQREAKAKSTPSAAKTPKVSREKPRRLSYQEQREWDGMEERILIAEEEVVARQREVEDAGSSTDHLRLRQACEALQAAQEAIEKLYGRWQELEAKQQ